MKRLIVTHDCDWEGEMFSFVFENPDDELIAAAEKLTGEDPDFSMEIREGGDDVDKKFALQTQKNGRGITHARCNLIQRTV